MPVPSQPTLIIGLGGIGCRIVENVYRQFEAGNPSDIDRRNVSFLCLDTDRGDVKQRKEVLPENCVVKTSSDMSDTIGGYISRIQKSTTVLNWFDTSSQELLSMPLDQGAAQVRMASRLALISAINEGKLSAIDNSINQLMAVEPERHKGNIVDTYIVCSLAGGTGAGSFLQTAYYVKNSMVQHGANAPKITGFFLLADVLCDDPDKGFSLDQKENVRSNTYACMKELVAFSTNDDERNLKTIEFEYRLGQKDKRLPVNVQPYDQCYIVDYTGASGENLGKEERYENQVSSFVFLTAFSPTGDELRSKAINDVRQKIQAEPGTRKYAGLGVSKLVYPVDDLFAYFARQRVVDNMKTSWRVIDMDYQKRYEEYKKNKKEGIPTPKLSREDHFINQLEELMKESGSIGAEFKEIYRSTQVYEASDKAMGKDENTEFVQVGPKSVAYLNALKARVTKAVTDNSELKELREECRIANIDFTTKDNTTNDLQFVVIRERNLSKYKQKAESFIDNMKRSIANQCFFADHDNENYVTKTPDQDKHRMNTFILEQNEEMHPLAVRYFLYDLKRLIEQQMKKLEGDNKKLKKSIDDYEKAFDDPDTKDRTESAVEKLKSTQQKNDAFFRKIGNLVTGQKPYREIKQEYETKSAQQAQNIEKYASSKLLEEVYTSMKGNINRLLEESENFFDRLEESLQEVDNERLTLLKKHDSLNDKDVSYVLASEQIKKDIYESVISSSDSPFFPTKMSAALYRSMYHNVCVDLNGNKFATSRKVDEKARKKAALEANKKIIEECVGYQEQIIKESNNNYATKNVIAALKEEALRECDNDPVKAKEYAEHKFQMFRDQAVIYGPDTLGTEVRHINAWGLHPDCIGADVLTQQELDDLFGSQRVDTDPENAATRLVSTFFSPFEIVRANSVTLLSINKHFRKFHNQKRTELVNEHVGSYYEAYDNVIKRVFATERGARVVKNGDEVAVKDCSPHLDKRWHLPAYMPNIGSSVMEETKKLFDALCYGLLLGKFKAVYNGGEYYWKHQGTTSKWLRDTEKGLISIGQSLDGAINLLFEKGLLNNPGAVDDVCVQKEGIWANANEEWLDTEHDETNELDKMKENSLVKQMVDFKFELCPQPAFKTTKNWFHIINAKRGSLLYSVLTREENFLIDYFFEDLIDQLIKAFGQSANTYQLCKYIFNNVDAKFRDDYALRVLEKAKKEGRFEPQE